MKLKIGTRRKENAIICSMCSYSFWAKTSWRPRQRGKHEQSLTFVTRTEAGCFWVTLFLMLNSERKVCRDSMVRGEVQESRGATGPGRGKDAGGRKSFRGKVGSGGLRMTGSRSGEKQTSGCREPGVRAHAACLQKRDTLSHRGSSLSPLARVGTQEYLCLLEKPT